MEFLQNVCLAYLQLLMNTSAKYQANWIKIVGVVLTRFCVQTARPTDRPADPSILPYKLCLRGYNNFSSFFEFGMVLNGVLGNGLSFPYYMQMVVQGQLVKPT